ncbi:MAG: hypothetical protein AB1715_10520, partial [Acidobacteriota bacterium]
MKTQRFAADLVMGKKRESPPAQAVILIQERRVSASIHPYEPVEASRSARVFARVELRRPLFLKWRDPFNLLHPEKKERLARGIVLHPSPPKKDLEIGGAGCEFLAGFSANEIDMLAALCREKGAKG